MKLTRLAAASLTIFSVATPVSPAATTSGTKSVIGGTNAGPTEFPFFVQGQGCGASLIWYDVALSAAHCEGSPFNTSAVLIGNVVRNSVTSGVLTRTVTKQIKHPGWNPTTFVNDFLMLQLSEEVPRNHTFIKLIEINGVTHNPADNDTLTIIGFGYIDRKNAIDATNLQKAQLYSGSTIKCMQPAPKLYSSTTMLCAFASNKSGCNGDSGGPLIDARGVQVGVTSWGSSSCTVTPTYFARVSAEYSWIRHQICVLSSKPPAYCPSVSITNIDMVEGDSTTISFTSQGPPTAAVVDAASVDWGDGSVDAGNTTLFTHQYRKDGNFTIQTSVRYGAYVSYQPYKELPVCVRNAAPTLVVSGIPNTTQAIPYTATVVLTCSDAGALDNHTICIDWNDFSARANHNVSAPSSANCRNLPFSHVFTRVGTFNVTATVQDSGGAAVQITSQLVTICNLTFTLANSTIAEGSSVALTVSGKPGVYGRVNWGDGSGITSGLLQWPFTHKYSNQGIYTITTDYDDGNAGCVGSKEIPGGVTVVNVAPTLSMSTAQSKAYTATATINCFDAGDADIVRIYIHWGDATSFGVGRLEKRVVPPASSNCINVLINHTYTQVGTYEIKAMAIDDGYAKSNNVSSTLKITSGRRRHVRRVVENDIQKKKNNKEAATDTQR